MDKKTYFLLTFAGVLVLLTIVNLIYFKVSVSLIKYKEKKSKGNIGENNDNFSIIELRGKYNTDPDLHTGNPPLTQPPYPTPPVNPSENQNVTIRNSHHKQIHVHKDQENKPHHKIHEETRPIIINNKTTEIPAGPIIPNSPPPHLGNSTESTLPEPIIPTQPLIPNPINDPYGDWDDDLFHKKDKEYHFNKTMKMSDPKEANFDGTILDNPLSKLDIINLKTLSPETILKTPENLSENKEIM